MSHNPCFIRSLVPCLITGVFLGVLTAASQSLLHQVIGSVRIKQPLGYLQFCESQSLLYQVTRFHALKAYEDELKKS